MPQLNDVYKGSAIIYGEKFMNIMMEACFATASMD